MNDGNEMTKDTKHMLARLERVLDTYGPESARWPASEREPLMALSRTEPEGRRLLAEAQALARVMDALPPVSANDALKARIVTAAISDPEHDARVVPISAGMKSFPRTDAPEPFRKVWPAAALAASFAIGLYLGVAGIGGQTFETAVRISGLSSAGGESDNIHWLEDGSGSEDVL